VKTAMTGIVGLDVGGAHLKVARVESSRVTDVRQIGCALWQGIGQLDTALDEAMPIAGAAALYAVTMTAELTEIFESREAGVCAIIRRIRRRLSGDIRVFMGLKGFATPDSALADPLSAASANFLASVQIIAARRPRTLLIDMGSTTTDIIACDRPQGLTDAERLQTGELVYTGLTRTPVASVATRAPLAGVWQNMARDAFATMADVRRIVGVLADGLDVHATTDGRGKSLEESLARFARGFGRDADIRHLATWRVSAEYVIERQLRSVHDGAIQVLSRPGIDIAAVVTAGIGAPVTEVIASRLGLPAVDFGTLIDAPAELRLWATRCAPAVAVALAANDERVSRTK
jgi:probable H4MPT-linked C1 transfer pathway protein